MNPIGAIRRALQEISCILLLSSGASMGLAGCVTRQDPRVAELPSPIGSHNHAGPLAFSPDGKAIALPKASDGRVEIWDLETRSVRYLESPFGKDGARAFDVAFSKDGRFLAANFEPGGVGVSGIARPEKQIQIPIPEPTWFTAMAFQRGAPKLVTIIGTNFAPGDYSSARWDVLTGKLEETHQFDRGLQFQALSPDGQYALFHNGREHVAFESVTGKKVVAFAGSGEAVFSDDASMLVSYDGESVTRWAVPTGKKLGRIQFESSREPPGGRTRGRLSISPDNRLLAIGCFTQVNLVAIVSLESGKVLDTFACCPRLMFCSKVRFSPDSRILVTDTEEHNQNDQPVEPLLRFWKIPDEW
jgi:WD40 repeat protein